MKSFEQGVMVIVMLTIVTISAKVLQRTEFENAEPVNDDLREPLTTRRPPGIGSGNHHRCRMCRMLGLRECINRFCEIMPHTTYQATGVGSGNNNRCSLCRRLGIQECIDRFCQTVEIVAAVEES